MNQSFRDMRVKLADVNAQLESSISGIRVSKSFTNEEYEKEKFGEGNKRFRSSKYTAYKYMAIFHTGIEYFSNMLNVVVISSRRLTLYTEMDGGCRSSGLYHVCQRFPAADPPADQLYAAI
jgi:ATP-binding cassette subfamily B protein